MALVEGTWSLPRRGFLTALLFERGLLSRLDLITTGRLVDGGFDTKEKPTDSHFQIMGAGYHGAVSADRWRKGNE